MILCFLTLLIFLPNIDSTNLRCSIAQRGKSKQKRYDLRQVGLTMVVTQEDMIPVFHHIYDGNMNDTKVFKTVIGKSKKKIIMGRIHLFIIRCSPSALAEIFIIKEYRIKI